MNVYKATALILSAALALCLCACGEKKTVVSPTSPPPTYTIADEIVADETDFSFVVNNVTSDGTYGVAANVSCVNKTSDKTLKFVLEDISVDGIMMYEHESTLNKDVAAGETGSFTLDFDEDSFSDFGIDNIDELTFTLWVGDADVWTTLYEETHTVYPTGMTAETVVYPVRGAAEGDTVILDDNIKFIIIGVDADNFSGYLVKCYIVNSTESDIHVAWDNPEVNGCAVSSGFSTNVCAGKCAYWSVVFQTADFEANGIDSVELINFALNITDANDRTLPPLYGGQFSYAPPTTVSDGTDAPVEP